MYNSTLVGLKNNLKKMQVFQFQKMIALCGHILGFEKHCSFSRYICPKVDGIRKESTEDRVA